MPPRPIPISLSGSLEPLKSFFNLPEPRIDFIPLITRSTPAASAPRVALWGHGLGWRGQWSGCRGVPAGVDRARQGQDDYDVFREIGACPCLFVTVSRARCAKHSKSHKRQPRYRAGIYF